MIKYQYHCRDLNSSQITGFFQGWPNPPDSDTHLKILHNSSEIVLAIDDESGNIVGFINAVSDKILCAYIPLLEVLPDYQGRGIGRELLKRMLDRLKKLYAVDLTCDGELQSFYEKSGMKHSVGMVIRRYENQSGKPQNAN